MGEGLGFEGVVFAHVHIADRPALDDDLRAGIGIRLEQHRVHVGMRRNAAGRRLQRLGAADLPPSGVTAELRAMFCALNGATPYPRRSQKAAESGGDDALADIRAGAADKEGAPCGRRFQIPGFRLQVFPDA